MSCAVRWSALAVLSVLAGTALAEAPPVGRLTGRVVDDAGRPVAMTSIVLSAVDDAYSIAAVTDADGRFRLADVPAGGYAIADTRQGPAGSPLLVDVRAGATAEVEVRVPRAHAAGQLLTRGDADALPLPVRGVPDLLRTVPGLSAAVPGGVDGYPDPVAQFGIAGPRAAAPALLVDGVLERRTGLSGPARRDRSWTDSVVDRFGSAVPGLGTEAMDAVRIDRDAFSAEYADAAGGVVDVITRRAPPRPVGHVDLAYGHDAGSTGPAHDGTFGAATLSIGTPLGERDRLSFTYRRDRYDTGFDRSAPDYVVAGLANGATSRASRVAEDAFSVRLDRTISERHAVSLTARYASRRTDALDAVLNDGFNPLVPLAERDRVLGFAVHDDRTTAHDLSVRTTLAYTSGRATSARTVAPDASGGQQVFVEESDLAYAFGPNAPDGRDGFDAATLAQTFGRTAGRHALTAGYSVDWLRRTSERAAWVQTVIGSGVGAVDVPAYDGAASLTDTGVFVNDSWSVTSRLVFDAGLRAGRDTRVRDLALEPRLGFSYTPGESARTRLHGGIGVYHDRDDLLGATGALRPVVAIGTPDPFDRSFTGTGEVVSVADPRLRLPELQRYVLGLEQRLARTAMLDVRFSALRGHDLFRTDLVAPAAAKAAGAATWQEVHTNRGSSRAYALEVALRQHLGRGADVELGYAYGRSTAARGFDYLVPFSLLRLTNGSKIPANRLDVDGAADDDARHTATLTGRFLLPARFRLGVVTRYRSGLPWTVYDVGDYASERPVTYLPEGYNSRRAPPWFGVDLRVAKPVALFGWDVEFTVDVFNATDRRNVISVQGLRYVSDAGTPGPDNSAPSRGFGEPQFLSPPRTFRVSLRFKPLPPRAAAVPDVVAAAPAPAPAPEQAPTHAPEPVPVEIAEPAATGLAPAAAGPEPIPLAPRAEVVLDGVAFDFDSTVLLASSRETLERVARSLGEHPDVRVEIGGHTDARGTAAYNLRLSEGRAAAVREFLVAAGIAPERLSVRGYGMTQPVADNATEEGRAKNRRVTLTRSN